ncbi:MAG: ATP synthase F1 subunit delta [Deltaproteobacteria bacterium]|nr:ATP synthase F1 subunit delta [Deltaproteobacteria bacterium]
MKGSVAARYARALIETGREDNSCDRYGRELRTVEAVFAGNPVLYKVLLNPMYRVEERKGVMGKVAESLKLSPYVSRFLNILVETRNIRFLDEISKAYSRLEDEIAGRVRATVESPGDIDPALLDEIRKKLSSILKKDVLLSHGKNPALIGGLLLRIENTILDGSLKNQLELMKEKILEGAV